MSKKIAVIDGNSLMHRAYHAVPPTMNAPDGTPTNAAFGFLSMLLKFIDDAAPDALICAFDAGRPKFRMEAIEQYKAQRPPMDEELKVQFPLIEELLEAMSIPVARVAGWEGDDVLGTLAARADCMGYETLLVTGDKDAYQLASDSTRIVTTKKGISDVVIYGPKEVEERYGIRPEQVPDYLGLKGDASDNIPGISGIGEKTATKLLQAYGNLEGLYEHLDELKGKQKERIEQGREAAFASRRVATIVRDLEVPIDLEACSFPSFDPEVVTEAFRKVRFNSHLSRVLKLIGAKPTKQLFEIKAEPVVSGPDARSLVDAAIERNETVGVSFVEAEQASLFSSGLHCAVGTSEGTALFQDAEALNLFAHIVREGSFVALNVKDIIHLIYPEDTAQKAFVTADDLMSMQAFDLSLAGYVLNSSVSQYSFDTLLQAFCGASLPEAKDEAGQAAIQAATARMLQGPLSKAIEQDGSHRAYFDIDLPLVAVLAIVERTGAALDCDRLAQLGSSTQVDLDALRAQIVDMAGEDFNLDSPKQLAHILFEVLGLKPIKKNQRGYSTDASVLKELENDHELPGLILRYRELAKIKSTYIDALPRMAASGDKRVHTRFNETVTTTGRLSSSDPNLQNIPVRTDFGRQIRECFVPLEEGSKFLSADYSQIELRLLAHLSADEHLIDAFCSGADFHAATASRVFGLPVDQITPELRSRAKAVNFGIVYGQQAFGLSQSLGISFGEAKEMIDRYFEAYPGVRAYLDRVVLEAKQAGYAETMFGRKRHIPELHARNANQRGFGERTAMNHPMQGSAADIIKLAMVEVQQRLMDENFEARLLLQVHDELDFSVPIAEIDRLSALVKDVMENVVSLSVPLVVDVSFGDNWAQAH